MISVTRSAGASFVLALVLSAVSGSCLHGAQGPAFPAGDAPEAVELARLVDGFLAAEPHDRPLPSGRCLIVPAVTDNHTGALAGKAFARLRTDADRVILLATRTPAAPATPAVSLPAWESMRTALGAVTVDTEALSAAAARPGVAAGQAEGPSDRAMASVLPFLQRRLSGPFRLVPLDAAPDGDPSLLAGILRPLLALERTALVVLVPGPLAAAEVQSLFEPFAGRAEPSPEALPAALRAVRLLAEELGWRLAVTGSGTPTDGRALLSAVLVDDPNRLDLLLGATAAAWEDPLTRAAFEDAARAAGRAGFVGDPLSQPEQTLLLYLARTSIAARLQGKELPAPPLYSDTLAQPSGCFVTITLNGALRGCLGTVLPSEPLAVAVQRYAVAAAFEDKRFQPLTLDELSSAVLEIGVVTPPVKVSFRDADDLLAQIEAGTHGVLITHQDGKRATFLPQVWKQFPDKALFLTALCRKGGIPADAWRDPARVTIQVYRSFDFREPAAAR